MARCRSLLVWLLVFSWYPQALVWALDPLPLAQMAVQYLDIPIDGQFGTVFVYDVNTQGDVVGTRNTGLTGLPYLLRNTTTITPLQCAADAITAPQAINRPGQIVGTCYRAQGTPVGFLYDTSNRGNPVSLITIPQTTRVLPMGLNDTGAIVGAYYDAQGQGPIGFIRLPRGQIFPIAMPGTTGTVLHGISNRFAVVGYVYTPDGRSRGLLLAGGQAHLVDLPGGTDTLLWDINDLDEMVGVGIDDHGQPVSFLYNGTFLAIDVPAPHRLFTDIASINNLGQMGGRVLLTTDDAAQPVISQGLLLTPIPAEVAGVQSPTMAQTLQAPRQAVRPQARAATVRVALDPCAEEDAGTVVPLRLRGLCLR
jgi:hypothetical protein